MTYYNTKKNCNHYSGKIWLNGSLGTRGNICADIGEKELMVIAYVSVITEQEIINWIKAMGWNPEYWLQKETA